MSLPFGIPILVLNEISVILRSLRCALWCMLCAVLMDQVERHLKFIDFTQFGKPSPIWINFVRDPVDRYSSQYYYWRTLGGKWADEIRAANKSLECLHASTPAHTRTRAHKHTDTPFPLVRAKNWNSRVREESRWTRLS